MRHIKLYEKFSESEYSKNKLKKEKKYSKKLIQKLGNKYIMDIVAEGDFDGLNYLLNTGYSLEGLDLNENLLVTALKNNQIEMFEWLLYKSDYFKNCGWNKGDEINSIILNEIIGEKIYNERLNRKQKVTPKMVDMLKTITKYGYDFGLTGRYNLIELYLTDDPKWIGKDPITNMSIYSRNLLDGVEPFIDWLLENYPDNYKLCRDFLSEKLKKKYSYFEEANKYNL